MHAQTELKILNEKRKRQAQQEQGHSELKARQYEQDKCVLNIGTKLNLCMN